MIGERDNTFAIASVYLAHIFLQSRIIADTNILDGEDAE